MNKFVKSEFDKFQHKTVVALKDNITLLTTYNSLQMITPEIGFRQISIEGEPDALVIDIVAISSGGLNLLNGELQMIIDGKQLSFLPHESFSEPHLNTFHIESDYYDIEQSELKEICDAKTLEIRVTNGKDYADIPTNKIQWGARVMYNALFDKDAYKNEILKVSNEDEKNKYVEKYKSGLVWTWVLGIIAIVIGIFCTWWLVFMGAVAICIYQFCFSKKKIDIINSTDMD